MRLPCQCALPSRTLLFQTSCCKLMVSLCLGNKAKTSSVQGLEPVVLPRDGFLSFAYTGAKRFLRAPQSSAGHA